MGISFIDNWRARHGSARGVSVTRPRADDRDGLAELLAECEALRSLAYDSGLELDDSADSLAALDQVMPRWRDDPERMARLGNDAGLYLGTVVVHTVPGARWRVRPDGQPVVRLASGREFDVVRAGRAWADGGTPELAQTYAEVAEGHGSERPAPLG
ncbi:DUF6278 family protein [Streptomyces sp. PTM05]|uniref:DUF6278 family protein n=1 Tax=Streptantibioticus parmotrematis TaxID=2873249 RepID=A0ABS7QRR3_9ACTN|nr:DUF6278 family protein [Streptantibioticus parmotrematis]MBY8885876.1 DUF6278 family protein [Streptantibioticus parmotrematis]